jgi:hypothetical protein
MSDVRADLKEVESEISRLLAIGKAFQSKDRDWSHYKNKEDWGRNIPQIKDGLKQAKVERIYCDGRDMAGYMADALLAINFDISHYPTLTSIIDKLKSSWAYSDLDPIVEEAQRIHEELGLNCWAFNQMVFTFKDQQNLSAVVRQTLDLMKKSNLYKKENGLPIEKDAPNVSFGNVSGSNISVGSSNVSQTIRDSAVVFSQLRGAILTADIENKELLTQAVQEMEDAYGSSAFIKAYQQFMLFATDYIKVVAPYLPALAALL